MNTNIVFPEELEYFVQSLRVFGLDELGTDGWLDCHQKVLKLSQQAYMEAAQHCEETVKEALLVGDSLKTLVHEAWTIFTWKTHILPLLLKKNPEPDASFLMYSVLYHEGAVVSLLDLALYHKSACEMLRDSALDLVDYACIGVAQLVALSDAKKDECEDTLSELERQKRELLFKIGMRCISILGYLIGNVTILPLSCLQRLALHHDVPMLMVNLANSRPWERRNKKNELERFGAKSDKWETVPEDQREKLHEHEATIWITLHQFIFGELAQKYEFNSESCKALGRLSGKLNERVLDQIPPMFALKRALCEIGMRGPTSTKSRANLVLEEVPQLVEALKSQIKAKGGYANIAEKQALIFLTKDKDKIMKMAKSLNEAYNTDLICEIEEQQEKSKADQQAKDKNIGDGDLKPNADAEPGTKNSELVTELQVKNKAKEYVLEQVLTDKNSAAAMDSNVEHLVPEVQVKSKEHVLEQDVEDEKVHTGEKFPRAMDSNAEHLVPEVQVKSKEHVLEQDVEDAKVHTDEKFPRAMDSNVEHLVPEMQVKDNGSREHVLEQDVEDEKADTDEKFPRAMDSNVEHLVPHLQVNDNRSKEYIMEQDAENKIPGIDETFPQAVDQKFPHAMDINLEHLASDVQVNENRSKEYFLGQDAENKKPGIDEKYPRAVDKKFPRGMDINLELLVPDVQVNQNTSKEYFLEQNVKDKKQEKVSRFDLKQLDPELQVDGNQAAELVLDRNMENITSGAAHKCKRVNNINAGPLVPELQANNENAKEYVLEQGPVDKMFNNNQLVKDINAEQSVLEPQVIYDKAKGCVLKQGVMHKIPDEVEKYSHLRENASDAEPLVSKVQEKSKEYVLEQVAVERLSDENQMCEQVKRTNAKPSVSEMQLMDKKCKECLLEKSDGDKTSDDFKKCQTVKDFKPCSSATES